MTPLGRVMDIRVGRASDKLVFIVMAHAAEDGQVARSVAELERATELDRKSVGASLRRLVAGGWLIPTGVRRGSTGRVPVYRLSCTECTLDEIRAENAQNELTADSEPLTPIGPKTGQLNKPENGPITRRNRPKNGPIGQAEIGPKTGLFPDSRSTEVLSTETLKEDISYQLPTPVQPENPILSHGALSSNESVTPQPLTLTSPAADTDMPRPKEKRQPRKLPTTPISADWRPEKADIEFAADRGLDPQQEAPRFVAYHMQKGSLMASWAGAWRTWCLNKVKWQAEDAKRLRPVTMRDVVDRKETYTPSELRTSL